MKNIDLSNILLSLGKSVDKATIDLRKSNLNCELDEVEFEIELSVDLDKETLDKEPKSVKQINFLDIRSAAVIDRSRPVKPVIKKLTKEGTGSGEHQESCDLTRFRIKALFTTKLYDE